MEAATKREKSPREYRGRTWVTRPGVRVDRLASAWWIRRFLDPEARFAFAVDRSKPVAGQLRFDMFEAEFTHEGDKCTFEVLLDHFAVDDPALRAIAEVVHDLDLKDGKFGRPETEGIGRVIAGIASPGNADEQRLQLGQGLFDALYAAFGSAQPAVAKPAKATKEKRS